MVYNAFVATERLGRFRFTSKIWHALWRKSCSLIHEGVATKIHGRTAEVNYGFPYPFIARQFSSFNNPLVEIVYQTFRVKKREVTLIDVGSSVGDTVLLIEANCPGMVEQYYCIEGDREFYSYLTANLAYRKGIEYFPLMLSSHDATIPALVRTHSGTASAIGNEKIRATSLDNILFDKQRIIDIVKIDVDGFDGEVLKGSKHILRRHKPAVIFEWHPLLCQRAENNWKDHFTVLAQCGYTRFLFFTKFGEFNHIMIGYDKESVEALANFSLTSKQYEDWHYDIIALHQENYVDASSIADCAYAKAKRSPY